MATSSATAHWTGTLTEGSGTVSTTSAAINSAAVTWKARTGGEAGTTPEELLGAAHAACYCMALSGALAKEGFTPTSLDATAAVSFGPNNEGGFAVQTVSLSLDADIDGIDDATFHRLADQAKSGCPISAALAGNVEIELEAKLASIH